jgi:F-type H+-transporting ATPase subunit a
MLNFNLVDFYVDLPPQMKSSFVITGVLIIFSILLGLRIKKLKPTDKPPLIIVVLEMAVDVINNLVKTNIGKRWRFYAPYILTLAMFLLFANTSSIWGLTPPTSYVSLNAALALISFLLVQGTGIVTNGIKEYAKSFVGPVPLLAILILPINIIGEFAFPFSLCLRLFGNILSGGVLSLFLQGMLGHWIVLVNPVFNAIFDIALGFIQVLVFVLLTTIFISMKVNEEEKIY